MNDHETQNQHCPNKFCKSYKQDEANISVHDRKRNRFRCRTCGKTWVGHNKDFCYGLRTNPQKIERALIMLRAGLPIRHVAELSGVSPSTVMRWKRKAKTKF